MLYTISELDKYGVKEKEYYYTVSSLLPHKNLETLVLLLAELKEKNSKALFPLIISGVGGSSKDKIINLAKDKKVDDYVILTAFVEDAERNMFNDETENQAIIIAYLL